ncbi:MAG: YHS domain-containing protein [Sphingobacteriaceae bacterium]|nr:MAG: YHS domain-containing protein [Sphingobacteriaceae bacterium]
MKYKNLLIFLLLTVAASCKQKTETKRATLKNGNTHVAILLYPGVELLDFSGPAEVFSNAKGFEVYTVSTGGKNITTKNSTLKVTADYTLQDAPQPDIIVVPGGPMTAINPVTANVKTMDWIKQASHKTQLIMSVCTGAEILGKAGLLENKSATTHQSALDTLQSLYKNTRFVKDVRFVEDGKLLTTAGVSAGIDGALHVVQKLKGLKEALFVTLVMQYDKWKPEEGLIANAKPMTGMQSADRSSMEEKMQQKEVLPADGKDIVCGMPLMKSSKYTYQYKGKVYGFCSPGCKKLFVTHPELYVSK